jgi:hypothetical protein
MTVTDKTSLTPKQVASLRAKLQATNARLVAVERERRKLKENVANLVALLERAESGRGG